MNSNQIELLLASLAETIPVSKLSTYRETVNTINGLLQRIDTLTREVESLSKEIAKKAKSK